MGTTVSRGGSFPATFQISTSLDTSTSLDASVYLSASSTVGLMSAVTITTHCIGQILETKGTEATVNLRKPTQRAIAGGAVTAGARLTFQSATGYLITATGTLTANAVRGLAITGAAVSGEKFEIFPLDADSVVIA